MNRHSILLVVCCGLFVASLLLHSGSLSSDVATGVSSAVPAAATAPPAHTLPARGVVVSCPRIGQIWGSDQMVETVAELKELGVRWVAIHPYAGVRKDGSIRHWATDETDYLNRAVEIVRAAGLELFLKPHLAYWGSFSWRGEIEFGNDSAAWQRFFDGYEEFILDQARFAERHQIPLFAVGVELEQTFSHAERWNSILAKTRAIYRGKVTYAANWSSVDAVTFWDRLDSIGVHAYYPVGAGPSDTGRLPGRAEIATGWDRQLAQLEALSKRYGKPITFAEIGYNRSAKAAAEPWDYSVEDSPAHRELRTHLIEVALEKTASADFIDGVFWWKWIPGSYGRRSNFSMRDEEARAALRRYWGEPAAATSSR